MENRGYFTAAKLIGKSTLFICSREQLLYHEICNPNYTSCLCTETIEACL